MSWHVQTSQITDITNKWELAQCISGHSRGPEQILKSIFEGAMQCMEQRANTILRSIYEIKSLDCCFN